MQAGLDEDLDSLLLKGVILLSQHAETQVLNILSPSSTSSAHVSLAAGRLLPDELQAVRQFLLTALVVVLSRGAADARPSNVYGSYSIALSLHLMNGWADLLEFCARAGDWPADASATSTTTLDQKALALRFLQQTVGTFMTMVVATLSHMSLTLAQVSQLLPVLTRCSKAFDALAVGMPEVCTP